MSLDYDYTLGYGFLVTASDIENEDILESEYGLYEAIFNAVWENPHLKDLVDVVSASSPMDDSPEQVLVALKRSLITGDPKSPEHDTNNIAVVENFDDTATVEENEALEKVATYLGVDFFIPQTYFYITVS